MRKPTVQNPLKIGTRGSPLALAQAQEVKTRLCTHWRMPQKAFEIITIITSGDKIQNRPLRDLGGKGLFTKEIEEQLLEGSIDIAVHSMKDMPVAQPAGLMLDIFLPREDTRDAFVSPHCTGIAGLEQGATVGTSSLRRKAQVLYLRPDLRVIEFRGNVQTRMNKLNDGQADATFLAIAGLKRLKMFHNVPATPVAPEHMLPAVAQGAIGVEYRTDNREMYDFLAPLNDVATFTQLQAERAFLAALDGSCQTPIAAMALLKADDITLYGEVLRPGGQERIAKKLRGPASKAVDIGKELAQSILTQMPKGFLENG